MISVNLLLVRGEAALSVGVIGIMLAFVGVIAGAILGAHRNLRTRPMIVGIVLGALPGLAMIFFMTVPGAPGIRRRRRRWRHHRRAERPGLRCWVGSRPVPRLGRPGLRRRRAAPGPCLRWATPGVGGRPSIRVTRTEASAGGIQPVAQVGQVDRCMSCTACSRFAGVRPAFAGPLQLCVTALPAVLCATPHLWLHTYATRRRPWACRG